MTWTRYYNFVPTKVQEEKGEASGNFPLQPFSVELVEVRDDPPHVLDLFNQWEIKKVLTAVDVGILGGLVLGQEQVYNHIFRYWNRELVWNLIGGAQQIPILIRDLDTKTEYNLYFKKSTMDDCFVISTFWNRDFVYRRDLKEGDMIGMYWHPSSSSFCFSVLKRAGGVE
ncbi:hypothetical protein BVC80_1543g207 [Macleaya cordata]|uniref:B3 DNA binding domain n=1 Tax=Macleaya cordata TaxID=56857 RepID=A0A200R200_MACCD|nr:hypothetical protein BVC80_1543g207 [Macleaya cordata]